MVQELMMVYKMIVLDMDGTLLNEEQKISVRNKEALLKAIEAGIHIVLASGRHYNGLLPYIQELGLDKEGCYSVSCSGAMVVDHQNHEVIYEEHVDAGDIPVIHQLCEKLDIDMCGYGKDGLFIHHDNLFSRYDQIVNQSSMIQVDFNHLNSNQLIYKLNIINESSDIRDSINQYFPTVILEDYSIRNKPHFDPDLLDELWRFPKFIRERYHLVRALPFMVELFHNHTNKAVGVEVITNQLGILMEDVVALGDSGNDVHMIEKAGLGVAMANAIEDVKNAADYITGSNTQDGVAQVVEKMIKNERIL